MFCYGCWECYPFIEGDKAIVRWHADDRAIDTIEYHVIYMYIVVVVPSHHRAIALSCYRPLSRHCYRTIAPSLHRYRIIASSHYRSRPRWWVDAIVNYMALTGFRTLCFFHLAGNISSWLIVWLNLKFFLQLNSFPHLYFRKYINF